ncbi:MAG: HD domain-containing phosphohydrolase, partial [Gemmatimonadota bacterium]
DGLGSPTTGPARGAREATGRVALAGDGRRILLVEADTSTRTLISTHLQKQGFSVTEATGASEAIRALSEEFDLFITDLQSQQSPGVRLVATLKARWPDTPAVAVTGFQDAQLAAEALTAGADRYLYRPFGMPELEAHLEDLLKFRERLLERREERAETRSGSLGYGPGAREAVLDALRALVRAAELRDPATRGHAERVRAYTLILAEALSGHAVRKLDRDALGLAGELMDVGKITVPEGILTKEGALSDREYEKVREHPRAGRSLLEPLLDDDVILAATAWHHERWDGQGYPDGLAGQAIPLPARIVAVADALDAMTSPRAYRPGLEWNDAVGQIRARSGTHFDPGLLSAFETALDRLRQIYEAAFPDGTPPAPEGGDAPREGDRTGGSSTSSDSPSDRAYDAAPPEEER